MTLDLEEEVLELIAETLGVAKREISMTDLVENLIEDSLDLVALGMASDERFGLQLDYSELDDIETVGDLVAFINARVSA